jgi:hypothetical protein
VYQAAEQVVESTDSIILLHNVHPYVAHSVQDQLNAK